MYRSVFSLPALVALAACSQQTPGVATPGVATPGVATPTGTAPQAADAGEQIYNGNCVPCHQQNGQGIPGVYPSLAGSPVVQGDPKALTLWVLKGQRPASMPAGRYSAVMLQFGWMKASEAAALFTYLRSNFGNSAPAVGADVVAAALAQ